MKRAISVTIYAAETTCGDCHWRGSFDNERHDFHCVLFLRWGGKKQGRIYYRHACCLAAEAKAKGNG